MSASNTGRFGQGRVGVISTRASRLRLSRFRTPLECALRLPGSLNIGFTPKPDADAAYLLELRDWQAVAIDPFLKGLARNSDLLRGIAR
jgi:hypothetical protein